MFLTACGGVGAQKVLKMKKLEPLMNSDKKESP